MRDIYFTFSFIFFSVKNFSFSKKIFCYKIFFPLKFFFSANNVCFVKNTNIFSEKKFFFQLSFETNEQPYLYTKHFCNIFPTKTQLWTVKAMSFSGKYVAKMFSIKIWLFICWKNLKKKLFLKKYLFFTKYTLFAEKKILYGKKVFILKNNFFTEKNINKNVKNIYLISEIY